MKTVCITQADDGSFRVSELPEEVQELVGYDKGEPAATIDDALGMASEMLGAGGEDMAEEQFTQGYGAGQPPMPEAGGGGGEGGMPPA